MPAERHGWDVHTHLVPATVVETAAQGRFDMARDEGHLVTPQLRFPLTRIADPSALTGWVDENGLEGAIVSPPPPLYRPDLDDSTVETWTSLLNEGLAEACGPDHLRPLAYLPVERPALAVRVLEDLDDTWAGVILGTDLAGLVYSDPAYGPLWETLVARDLAAFIHPGACPDTRLDQFYLANLVGNPYEVTVAAAHLVFGDVLGRHPELRILLAHGGGATAALAGRWQRGHDTARPGLARSTLPPREALRRFWVDSLVHDPSYLRHVEETFGAASVLPGSDWPFPMGTDSLATSARSDARNLFRL